MLTVAESLLEKCEVTFSDSVMHIVKPPCTVLSTASLQEPVSVLLTGIPPGTKEDILVMYLENKRKSGGGPIRSMQYSQANGSAVVCFEDDTSMLCFFVCLNVNLLGKAGHVFLKVFTRDSRNCYSAS